MTTPRAAYVYDDQLSRHVLREDHPMVPARLRLCHELMEAYGLLSRDDVRVLPPRPATDAELYTVHTREYVAAVRAFSQGDFIRFTPEAFNFSASGDNPVFPGVFEAAALSTGATLVAAEQVMGKRVSVGAASFSGGLHHAMPDRASGFCVFNDPAVAIRQMTARGLRVAYVDVDAHHGDGVQHAFYDTDQVLTISLHESGQYLFPGTGFVDELGSGAGRGYSVNVPLHPFTDDETYLGAFRAVAPPLVQAFRPDVLFTQMGVDSHYLDPLTHLALTTHGFEALAREFAALRLPWVLVGGGGYALDVVARAWTLAFAVMAGVDLPDEVPAPFADRYGVRRLHDAGGPDIPPEMRKAARVAADRSVEQVRAAIFPVHGL